MYGMQSSDGRGRLTGAMGLGWRVLNNVYRGAGFVLHVFEIRCPDSGRLLNLATSLLAAIALCLGPPAFECCNTRCHLGLVSFPSAWHRQQFTDALPQAEFPFQGEPGKDKSPAQTYRAYRAYR